MLTHWVTDDGEMHHAKWYLNTRDKVIVLHMQVESLGEHGWDWNAWEPSGCVRQRYGLADTLDEAKAKAACALGGITMDLVRAM